MSPFGFLSEHVETLYDLDIEAPWLGERIRARMVSHSRSWVASGLDRGVVDVVSRALRHEG